LAESQSTVRDGHRCWCPWRIVVGTLPYVAIMMAVLMLVGVVPQLTALLAPAAP
jgi:hypothetical protein